MASILWDSQFGSINAVLSIILVSWVGYLGAVIATLLTLYCWTVPYNLRAISRGFGTGFLKVLPGRPLFAVLAIGALACLPALAGFGLPSRLPIVQLAVGAALYGIAAGALMFRYGFASIPSAYMKYVPPFLGGRSRA